MRAYIDGSSKGLYGYLKIPSQELKVVQDHPMTNNQAEWMALLILLIDLKEKTSIKIYSDSQIVVNQFYGRWATRNETLKHLREVCLRITSTKGLKIHLEWVPREKNKFGKHLEKLLNREKRKRKKLREKFKRNQYC